MDFDGTGGGQYILTFVEPTSRNYRYFYYIYDGTTFPIASNESLTLVITDVVGRYYDPNIEPEIRFYTNAHDYEDITLDTQLRCDGNNDGHFEYIIDFSPIRITGTYMLPFQVHTTSGVAFDMNHGTMELIITRTDASIETLNIFAGTYNYIQVPFDKDSDSDGITDYSDPDNDDDGINDEDDKFPYDPSEWDDSDRDGVGDNEDDDDNGNMIPDTLEIPIAIVIVLVPIIVFTVMVKKVKIKGSEEDDGTRTIVYRVKYPRPPRQYRKEQKRMRKIQRKNRSKKKYL